MYEYLETSAPGILIHGAQLIRIGVQQKTKAIGFSIFGWILFVYSCNVKGVAKLAFKDGWLELITHFEIVPLGKFSFQETVVLLIGAERDKSRWRKISLAVRSQVNGVDLQSQLL